MISSLIHPAEHYVYLCNQAPGWEKVELVIVCVFCISLLSVSFNAQLARSLPLSLLGRHEAVFL